MEEVKHELEEFKKMLERMQGVVVKGENGYYRIKPKYNDTEMIKWYKNIPTEPKKLVKYSTQFAEKIWEKLEPKRSKMDWVYITFNSKRIYIPYINLRKIVSLTSLGIKPYLYGLFGTGKTTFSHAYMTIVFDREPVYVRLHGTPTVEEAIGEVDPISIYVISDTLKSIITDNYNLKLSEFGKMTSDVIELVNQFKNMTLLLRNIGIGIIENRPIIVDEIDKLSPAGANLLGSLFQRENPAIQIVGIGMVEAKLPVLTIGNSESLPEFVRSRLEYVKQPPMPAEIFDEFLTMYEIDDDIREKAIEKYKEMLQKEVMNLGTRKIIQWALSEQISKNTSYL